MATPSRTVQFRTIEDVIQAYENRDVPAWAIFAGNQFMFSFSGDSVTDGKAELEGILQKLSDNQSSAIYTLCIYEDLPKGGKIKSGTQNDGSFNFRLHEYATNYIPGVPGGRYGLMMNENKVLIDEIKALRMEVAELKSKVDQESEEDQDDEEDDLLGRIGKILENPSLQPIIQTIAGRITDFITPKKEGGEAENMGLRKIAGVPNSDNDSKVSEAVNILSESVPDLGDVLMKLANLSRKSPRQFNLYVGMIRSMK
jgi:FtsZ-binding cell division protein ZapB